MKIKFTFFLILFLFSCASKKELINISYFQTYQIQWSYCDKNVREYLLRMGKRIWQDTTTKIILIDSVYTKSNDKTYFITIPLDSILQFGGYQLYFSVQAIDSAGNYSAVSDTLAIDFPFKGDIFNEDSSITKIDLKDQAWFDDYYKTNYRKSFKFIYPKKKIPKAILYFE